MTPRWWALTRLRDACPACGTRFEPSRGEWTGALMFAQGFYFSVALLGLFLLLLFTETGLAGLFAWLGLSAVLLPLATYRNFKGAWVGTMWAAHPWEGGNPQGVARRT